MNNSGRSQRSMIAKTEFKVDQEMFELNVMGPISLTKAVLPHMIERNAGHIVAVSSLLGKFGRFFIYSFFKIISNKVLTFICTFF